MNEHNSRSALVGVVAAIKLVIAVSLAGCGGGRNEPPVVQVPPTDSYTKPNQVILSVSKFGLGVITAKDGNLTCTGQTCEGNFQKNTTVELRGIPDEGWMFSHWTGCTAVVDERCQVTLDQSKQVHPYFGKTTGLTVNSDVVELTDATMLAFLSRDGNVFTFSGAAEQLRSVTRGKILVSAQGEGFAVRVTNIYGLNAGNIVFDSEVVALDEIVAQGVFVKQVLAAAPTKVEMPAGLGRAMTHRVARRADGGAVSNISLNMDIGGGLSLEGGAEIVWNFDIGGDISPLVGLREFKFAMNPVVTPNIKVKFGKDNTITYKNGKENKSKWIQIPPIKLTFAPIPVGPVLLVPEVGMVYKVDASGHVEVDFASSYRLESSIGIHYVRGVGWNGMGSADGRGSFQPMTKAEAELKFGVGTKVGLKIAGVAGPYIAGGPYLKLSGEFDPFDSVVNLKLCNAKGAVDLGVAIDYGGEVNILSKTIASLEGSLIDKVLLNIFPGSGADSTPDDAVCKDLELPSAPYARIISATTASLELGWLASQDNVRVARYEVYKEGVKIGSTDTLSYSDKVLAADKAYCYRIVAIDSAGNRSIPKSDGGLVAGDVCGKTLAADTKPPQAPTDFSASATSTTSISLSWAKAQDESGIAKYLIVINEKQSVESKGLTVNILKLSPGQIYCFKVFAFDGAGNRSDASSVCSQTLDPSLAKWTLQLGCQNQDWLIAKGLDLNLDLNSDLVVTDTASDYNGSTLVYHLAGTYIQSTAVLAGKIRWTFENSTSIREDAFTVNLASGDTGDVNMTQVLRTGCDAKVRLMRN